MATTLKLLGTGAYFEGNAFATNAFLTGGVVGMVGGKVPPLVLVGLMTLHHFTRRGVTITLLGVFAVNAGACVFNLGEILTL